MTTHVELISGAELDYLAAIAKFFNGKYPEDGDSLIDIRDGKCWVVIEGREGFIYRPSKAWADATILLEQYIVALTKDQTSRHYVATAFDGSHCMGLSQCEAITRAYVAMKLGATICFTDFTLPSVLKEQPNLRPLPERALARH